MPLVSVIMSVYNSEQTVKRAIESILSQTFVNFEFLIINDGSLDMTGEILDYYHRADARIRIFSQRNHGLTYSLNKLISLSKGIYIARQDADDYSMPSRLAEQVEFMESHSDVAVVGCWFRVHFSSGLFWDTIPNPKNLRKYLLKGINPFMHSSVMMRKSLIDRFEGPYRFKYAQDLDLWLRVSEKYPIAIVPRVLAVRYESIDIITNREQKTVTGLRKAMLTLAKERQKYGSEITDWRELEKLNILDKRRNTSFDFHLTYQKKVAFAALLNGDRKKAFNIYLQLFKIRKSLIRYASLVICFLPTVLIKFILKIQSNIMNTLPHRYGHTK